MKGIQGLIVAVVIGLIGAAFNFIYLSKNLDLDKVSFVGVSSNIEPGSRIKPESLVAVPIPEQHIGKLRKYAYLWGDRRLVIGEKSTFPIEGGGLVMREYLKTPPAKPKVPAGHDTYVVVIDTRVAIPDHIIPNVTPVSFFVPQSQNSWLGPFNVVTVGSRLGSPDVWETGRKTGKENKITLSASPGDAKMLKLQKHLATTNAAPLRIRVHQPIKKRKE